MAMTARIVGVPRVGTLWWEMCCAVRTIKLNTFRWTGGELGESKGGLGRRAEFRSKVIFTLSDGFPGNIGSARSTYFARTRMCVARMTAETQSNGVLLRVARRTRYAIHYGPKFLRSLIVRTIARQARDSIQTSPSKLTGAQWRRASMFGDTISGFERRRERDGGGGSSGGWVHNTTGVGRTNDVFGGKLSIGETDATVHEAIRDYGRQPRTESNVARRRRGGGGVNERRISWVVREFGVLSAFFLFFGRPFARSNEPGAPDRQKPNTFPLLLSWSQHVFVTAIHACVWIQTTTRP